MKQAKKFCPHCKASMNEHHHTLSIALVEGLNRIAQIDGPANLKILGLTRNQWDNFQKLRYWGLAEKAYKDDGTRLAGHWSCTRKGRDFLDGRISVPISVWTYRGEFIRADQQMAFVCDIDAGYKKREQYAEEARPHHQESLF